MKHTGLQFFIRSILSLLAVVMLCLPGNIVKGQDMAELSDANLSKINEIAASVAGVKSSGFEIKIKLDNYDEEVLYLGYHFGDKQYLRDSSKVKDNKGYFTFSADTLLEGGMYLVIMAPDKKHFQLIVDHTDQRFSVTADATQIDKTIAFKNSAQNEIFYKYMSFLGDKRKETDAIKEKMDAIEDEAAKAGFQEQMNTINKEVKAYQEKVVKNNPKMLLSAIIKANWEIEPPTFEGTEEEVAYKKFYYVRDNFFMHMDMSDTRLIRTPVMFPRVDAFVNKYHAIMPDSAIVAVDKVLKQIEGNDSAFRFFLAHFLNTYSRSKYVGMDAVYVHLVDNYYAKGKADWVNEENLEKIIKEAEKLKPILLGKIAPELVMQTQGGQPVSLHGVEAEFTVLIFWAPDCGHCKKSMPDLVKFADKFLSQGVKVFAVCSKLNDVTECWDMVKEKKMQNMINAVDPFYKTRFKDKYQVLTTPKIYILDRDKKIVSKNIGVEQLDEIVGRFVSERKG